MKSLLLGADIGSSSCKVVLIDAAGTFLANSRVPYEPQQTQPGWMEQDPEVWYRAFCAAIKDCLRGQSSDAPKRIQALSVCGPAHTVVLLDSSGKPLRPAILWSDLRSIPQARWLEEQQGDFIFDVSQQPVNPSWTLCQLLWVKQNEPDIWNRLHRIVIHKDYITYRLTGVWNTDPYDAQGTQLFDARLPGWSTELCGLLELTDTALPPVRAAVCTAGTVTEQAAADTGLPTGLSVAVGSGDSVVEALGAGVVAPGQAVLKLATSGVIGVATDGPKPSRRTMTYPYLTPSGWYTICATSSGAASALWFSHGFGEEEDNFATIEKMAASVVPGSEGLLFHPYLRGERAPHWDPRLRGDFVGVTADHGKAHFARAVLEGVAFSLRDCREMLSELSIPIDDYRLLGGGARSSLWSQIVADVFDCDLLRIPVDAAAFGAALLAGVTAGVYSDIEAAAAVHMNGEVVRPQTENRERYQRLFSLYQQTTERLRPIQHALSDLYRER